LGEVLTGWVIKSREDFEQHQDLWGSDIITVLDHNVSLDVSAQDGDDLCHCEHTHHFPRDDMPESIQNALACSLRRIFSLHNLSQSA
jgi:hypothetical protein